MATKKKQKVEKLESLRTFGYVLKNGKPGQVQAVNEQDAYDKIRQHASSFGIYGRKVFLDFYEVKL